MLHCCSGVARPASSLNRPASMAPTCSTRTRVVRLAGQFQGGRMLVVRFAMSARPEPPNAAVVHWPERSLRIGDCAGLVGRGGTRARGLGLSG